MYTCSKEYAMSVLKVTLFYWILNMRKRYQILPPVNFLSWSFFSVKILPLLVFLFCQNTPLGHLFFQNTPLGHFILSKYSPWSFYFVKILTWTFYFVKMLPLIILFCQNTPHGHSILSDSCDRNFPQLS